MCQAPILYSEKLDFIPATDPRLNKRSKKVTLKELKSEKMQKLIRDMVLFSQCEASPKTGLTKSRLVGLAAPQIGIMKQIIVIDNKVQLDNKENMGFEVLINPEIIWSSQEKNSVPQGCFSVPDCYRGVVERPSTVVVKALKPTGEEVQNRYEGYTAHVVQHEIDHLHGIRFPQRITNRADLHLWPKGNADQTKYRENWKKWPHHVSEVTFEQMKKGQYQNTN